MLSSKFSSKTYAQTRHSSNHLLKSLLKLWTTCSSVRTNSQCWKMMYGQPPSKFWSSDSRPEMTWKEVPNLRTNRGRSTTDKASKATRSCHHLHPLLCHMRSFFQWSASCSTSGGPDPSKRTQLREITVRSVLIIKSMDIPQSNAGVSITW